MNQQLFLQMALLDAIQKNSILRFEADGNKVIYIRPNSAYDLHKEIVEVRGSAEIVYLEGEAPNRFISKRETKKISLWVDEDFKVKKIREGEEIPARIEENLETPQPFYGKEISKNPFRRELSKEELETPPFLRK